jgi:hypothetical protein
MTGPLPPWPPLPAVLRAQLDAVRTADDPAVPPAFPVPRPWDLCSVTGGLADAVWTWLDQVARWLNHTYAAHDGQVVPACWRQHAGIAHDLAALAFSRVDVYAASTAAYVPRWHADLEDFHRRTAAALGPHPPCLRGRHDELPPRYTADTANHAITHRLTKEHRP